MIKIDPNTKINPAWIEARLSEHLPITSRFNIPATAQQVFDLLIGAVMSQVRRRRMDFVDNESLRNQIRQMAEWLTTDDCKC